MKSLKFQELLLVSHIEKRARKIYFHPKATVIRGINDTGKSSIIKNIFSTFGADPQDIHPRWKRANIASLLRFSITGTDYWIYRYGRSYSLFNGVGHLIGTFESVTNQLGPKLAELFDFKLALMARDGESKTPPPAYLFLPYYIDQDKGWTENWSSFEKLGQFKNWRQDLVYYHTGIHPNEWYELTAIIRALEIERGEPIQRERILKDVLTRLEKRLSTARFDINVEAYKDEINRLLQKCEALRKKEEDYKNKLVELDTERIRLGAQQEIVDFARKELFADYKFADRLTKEHVECPTCGASYDNSFAERFNIACDEDRCVNLLQQIKEGIEDINKQIKQHKDGLSDTNLELEQVNELLAAKQGEVTLKDLIENEGKREVSTTLNSELSEVQEQIARIEIRLRGLGDDLKKVSDRAHSQLIKNFYRELMHRNLRLLNVNSLDEATFRNIECSIRETGSDRPRAILAYVFSILHVIKRFGSSSFCPIVIDAPNQQEQDRINHLKMLEFTRDNLPEDAQLILALVDDCGVDFGGTVMDMTVKNFALSEDEYKSVAEEISPFSDANLGL